MPKLPETPKGEHLEDFVAALFQSAGYFVEKNIVEPDVMELDAVVTDYDANLPKSILVEAKSGNWGLGDALKLFGRMKYLGIDNGTFFVTRCPEDRNIDFAEKKMADMGIKLIVIDKPQDPGGILAAEGFKDIYDEALHGIFRYSFWVERKLLDLLIATSKSNRTREGPREARRWYSLVNDEIFFERDGCQRLVKLYEAYKKHPRLTLGVSAEMHGQTYDPGAADPDNVFFREAIFKGKHPLLQACMYIEHKARLSVLKCAVDYLCALERGGAHEKEDKQGAQAEELFSSLPPSCREGLDKIRRCKYFRLLPAFWQVFVWGWGGFLLRDREQELMELSRQTGVTEDEIPVALQVFDWLFPTGSGWLIEPQQTHFKLLKMVPAPFQGIGALHRLVRYEVKEYRDLGYGDYTGSDMAKWHNSSVRLLDRG